MILREMQKRFRGKGEGIDKELKTIQQKEFEAKKTVYEKLKRKKTKK
jgi:hypothetical protein